MPSPPQGPPPAPRHGEDPSPAAGEPERFGPLLLARLVKEDGRALILFSRARDGDPPGGEEPPVSGDRP